MHTKDEVIGANTYTGATTVADGILRLEGKSYVVQDGDVINFRFNV